MYAVVKTGGKQYRVTEGQTIQVEKLDAEPGATVELDQVLLLSDDRRVAVGRPVVDGAAVVAEVLKHDRHRKVIIFKYKRRKRYRRKAGHRQAFTALRVTEIRIPDATPAEAPAETETATAAE
jgi:large subunit ribosomal protein L21